MSTSNRIGISVYIGSVTCIYVFKGPDKRVHNFVSKCLNITFNLFLDCFNNIEIASRGVSVLFELFNRDFYFQWYYSLALAW